MAGVGDYVGGCWDGKHRLVTVERYRTIPAPHGGGAHFAWDVAMPRGTKLYAPKNGIVLDCYPRPGQKPIPNNPSGVNPGSGSPSNWVLLGCRLDGKPVSVYFQHLTNVNVKPGQKVKRGALIGWSGNSGNSGGDHLHYSINAGSRWRDRYAHISGGSNCVFPPSRIWGGGEFRLTPPPPFPGVPAVAQALKGEPAPWVGKLKDRMAALGYQTGMDRKGKGRNVWGGPLTKAVAAFQKDKKMTVQTGRPGPRTWSKIWGD